MTRRAFAVGFVAAALVAFPMLSTARRTIHGASCTVSAAGVIALENGIPTSSAQDVYCPLVDDDNERNENNEFIVMVCDKSTTTQINAMLCSTPLSGAAINCTPLKAPAWGVSHKGPEDISFDQGDNPFGSPTLGPGYTLVKTPSNGGTVYGICVGFSECAESPQFGSSACPN